MPMIPGTRLSIEVEVLADRGRSWPGTLEPVQRVLDCRESRGAHALLADHGSAQGLAVDAGLLVELAVADAPRRYRSPRGTLPRGRCRRSLHRLDPA